MRGELERWGRIIFEEIIPPNYPHLVKNQETQQTLNSINMKKIVLACQMLKTNDNKKILKAFSKKVTSHTGEQCFEWPWAYHKLWRQENRGTKILKCQKKKITIRHRHPRILYPEKISYGNKKEKYWYILQHEWTLKILC